jgi:predicted nucleic acid-binding protein
MTGVDCNILVQLAISDNPINAATLLAVEHEIHQGELLLVPVLAVTEFLHVVTDPKRFDPPLTMIEALDWVQDLFAKAEFKLLESPSESLGEALSWMKRFSLGRKRILDTYLAASLYNAGVRRLLTSNPADFVVFGVFEIVFP